MAKVVIGHSSLLARELAGRLRAGPDKPIVHLIEDPASDAYAEVASLLEADPRADPRADTGADPRADPRAELEVWNCAGLRPVAASDTELLEAVHSTGEALALSEELGAARFHHVSSISVGGGFEGTFAEKHFDEGQDLTLTHAQSAFEQERWVRENSAVPWRIYRPGIVIGNSRTGAMDGIDGPAHFFSALDLSRRVLPAWMPLVGPDFGITNMVPSDFVAEAMVALGALPGLDGEAFHLGSPERLNTADVHNIFATIANAPHAFPISRQTSVGALVGQFYRSVMATPALADIRAMAFRAVEIPEHIIERMTFGFEFDSTQTATLLATMGIRCPRLESYAPLLWANWLATSASVT